MAGTSLVIYGAGAIGRGYLPWVFPPDEYDYVYVEARPELRSSLAAACRFTSFRTVDGSYDALEVPVAGCLAPGKETDVLARAGAVITAVGPRSARRLHEALAGTRMPVVCCENDSTVPRTLAAASGNPNVVFGIPDVIASNTAPPELRARDPLAIVTEDGTCFIDDAVRALGGNCRYVGADELTRQWRAKLYIHNTPHCIAAYLGAIHGARCLHESMEVPGIAAIVSGAMDEMAAMLRARYGMDEDFVRWYSDKELRRFSNVLLHDPVNRVAREPFRKLAHNDRLIGAAELCLSAGVIPRNVLVGIMAAFWYEGEGDPDINIRYLRSALAPRDFLRLIIRLRPGDPLYELLLERWDENLEVLAGVAA